MHGEQSRKAMARLAVAPVAYGPYYIDGIRHHSGDVIAGHSSMTSLEWPQVVFVKS